MGCQPFKRFLKHTLLCYKDGFLNWVLRELPGGPAVRTWCFHCHGPGSIPGQGTKIPEAVWYGQKKFKNQNKRNKKPLCPSHELYKNKHFHVDKCRAKSLVVIVPRPTGALL